VNVDGLHADSRSPLRTVAAERPEPTGPVERDERRPMHAAAAAITSPVVNVTIGRIEVRVASASVPPATVRTAEADEPRSVLQRREPR
jgi:hypothetical protein